MTGWLACFVWIMGGLVAVPSVMAASEQAVEPVRINAEQPDAVARGQYLLRAGGCYACHTDSNADGLPLAGGPPLETAYGTFYAPNLTPSVTYGLGNWTLAQFGQALHKGVSPSGEPYYPAFPYEFYTRLSEGDVADLWAALQALPAVDQPSKAHDLKFPYSVRSALSQWQDLFFREGRFKANPDNGELFNRGAYLVNGPAHCAACHTPRNNFGALDWSRHLMGSDHLPGGDRAPSIRARLLKARGWTVESLAQALKDGLQPAGDPLLGGMAEVIEQGTRYLSDEDRRAIAHYILFEP